MRNTVLNICNPLINVAAVCNKSVTKLLAKVTGKEAIKILTCSAICLSSAYSFAAFNTNPPATGASQSGTYRNIYAELGKANIQTKVDDTFNKMFYGTSDEKLYYTYGTDEAYIKAIDSNDIRTEGMSWGMTIAVMMNKQAEFNRLWKFAYNHMKNGSGYNFPGTYGWKVQDTGSGITVLDQGPAADGELYFAFALFNASGRWGNGTGIYDYRAQANAMLDTLRTHLMESNSKQVVFTPFDKTYTDPSYHLPAFYDYFASVASSNNTFWSDAAAASRTFLQNHLGYGNGGLATYLSEFSGYPVQGSSKFTGQSHPGEVHEMDSWRVIMNIAVDAHLMGAQTWHKNAVNTLLYFLSHSPQGMTSGGICSNGYSQKFYQNGSNYGTCNSNNWGHEQAQTATNAAALLASTNATDASTFADALWNASWPTGNYRYYHGCLYMLATLHLSGNFKLYTPSNNNSSGITIYARGTNGQEHINLKVGGSTVQSWTLGTSYQNYVYSGTAAGDIQVQYDNDGTGGDVQVDYILVNNETRQAEAMSYNTGLYANGSCGGGGYSEMMHCNGAIGFGNTYDCFSGNCSGNINKVSNGTFDTDMSNWTVGYSNGAAATNGVQGGSAYVWISTAGTNNYDVQLYQNTTITQGKQYKVEFDARITEGSTRTIGVNIEKNVSPWTWYGNTSFTLSTSWSHYSYTYSAVSASDSQARLIFQLGGNSSDVNIDNVTFTEL